MTLTDLARIFAGTALAITALTMVGWVHDIEIARAVLTGSSPMKPLTALGLASAAVGTLLAARAAAGHRLGVLAGLVTAAVGAEVLLEYQLEFSTPSAFAGSSRMSVLTAWSLLMLGVAVVLINTTIPRARSVSRTLARVVGAIALIRGIAYLYGTRPDSGWELLSASMAINTVVCLALVALSVGLARPSEGLAPLFARRSLTGIFARRVGPAVLLIPIVLGYLCVQGVKTGHFGAEFGFALMVTSTIAGLGGMALMTLRALRRYEAERASAAEALRRSEQRFARLRDSGILGIFVSNPRGAVLEANDAFLAMTGYDGADVAAGRMLVAQLTPPTSAVQRAQNIERLDRTGQVPAQEREIMRKDGGLIPVLTVTAMLDESTAISLVLELSALRRAEAEGARARTELGKSELALARAEEQLRQAQKLEAVGLLAGGVAHDFNNLLSIILSYAQLMGEALPPEHPTHADLAEIQGAGQRAAVLTRQLLAFGRRQVLQPRVVNPNEVVSGLVTMLERVIGEDIELAFRPHAALHDIHVDRGQLEQVLMNLVVNARDAMPTGGKVTITTENVEVDPRYASDHLEIAPGSHVMLSVTDTGVGMDRDTQARIFEPFFTTKGPGKGTGLGLSVVFGIVKQSGGQIWVYSEPGQGTTFKVYFPRALPTVQTPARGIESMAPPRTGTETILLVEDEGPVRHLAQRVLERAGYCVLPAGHGPEAIELCLRHTTGIDLLLTDVIMPHMSGRELADRLTATRPDLRVLFMSGYTGDAILRHGGLSADVAFVEKPILPDVLLGRVRSVLDA